MYYPKTTSNNTELIIISTEVFETHSMSEVKLATVQK